MNHLGDFATLRAKKLIVQITYLLLISLEFPLEHFNKIAYF